MKAYAHLKVERKWQTIWEKKKIFQAQNPSTSSGRRPKFYGLIEFPYPSGSGLHVGHIRSNTAMDIISRKRRMEGYNVLYPIGWDAFGLPTENYAIKHSIHPIKVTKQNTDTFRRQLRALGFSFDWKREINTTDPQYYKWTQWIFLQLFKKGLAYKTRTEINWCPSCKIGLANEEVVAGACERCGGPTEKREKEQWMLAITKYAERLDRDLDTVDYLPKIKIQQRNWIGKSDGAQIEFKVFPQVRDGGNSPIPDLGGIRVFTTRPDTIFGATYVVLAPEHELVHKIKSRIGNWAEVEKYIKTSRKKSDIERTAEDKEKTGVELKGVKAINPATKEEIPIWIADYVLLHYGTGAIMAVPAHDERDFEFAKKYNLPMRQVIAPVFDGIRDDDRPKPNMPFFERNAIVAIVKHWKEDQFLILDWKKAAWHTLITGGVEEGQMEEEAARREIIEETGFHNLKLIKRLPAFHSHFYHVPKARNQFAHFQTFYFELTNDARQAVYQEEKDKHELRWVERGKVLETLTANGQKFLFGQLLEPKAITEPGILMNSGTFDDLDSEKAKKEIIKFVGGKEKITFKLRDWVFSRQRYWGEPIPLVFCPSCAKASKGKRNSGWVPVPDKDLPVKLPNIAKYKPRDDGESPLAGIKKWVNVKCPVCKGPARRETDTMPNWAGSSWYFLRYVDPVNNKALASKKNLGYWLGSTTRATPKALARRERSGGGMNNGGVDWYNGGMEHTTLHLLYSRFWHKFLYDLKVVPTSEPYAKRTSHGMILGEGGVKMSKSLGNVVNPDTLVKTYGADTLRLYEMFMGPFDQSVSWSAESLIGPRRFLEKVWRIGGRVLKQRNSSGLTLPGVPGGSYTVHNSSVSKLLHKTIKKVSEDIENMRFNTAISAMMVFANEVEKNNFQLSTSDFKIFLQILSPFAPHIAEELWHMAGEKRSIGVSAWPLWDKKLAADEEMKIAVQINGKVRAEVIVRAEDSEEKVREQVLSNETVGKYTAGKDVKKAIYVKGRLINLVI